MAEMRPSALKRLKDTYKGGDRVLPSLERHVMRMMGTADPDRAHNVLHPSEMSHRDWCGRHDYYRIVQTPAETEAMANPSFRMSNVFAEGHSIHEKYQTWLWEMEVLHGWWLCLSCGMCWEATSPRFCVHCESPRILYREVPLRRELVAGHADGALHFPDWSGLLEIKSIGIGTLRFEAPRLYNRYQDGETLENIWWKINRPFGSHVKQAMLYLWMAWPRYEEIAFIYESKFHQQTKEFVVSYNPSLIAPQLETAREVQRAVSTGVAPPRPDWATEPDSKVCKSCVYRRTCWQLGAPNVNTQADDSAPAVRVQRAASPKRRKSLRAAGV